MASVSSPPESIPFRSRAPGYPDSGTPGAPVLTPVVIAGAGPAGLTAAKELLRHGIRPVILEATRDIGGISRTVVYKGNRMDIGGHRFFSKSDKVMDWWRAVLPLQGEPSRDDKALGRASRLAKGGPDPEIHDKVLLVRSRLSRILFLRQFFPYPLTLSLGTLRKLGPARVARIGLSYLKVRLGGSRPEKSLEDFFINRFGAELYGTFFRDYTEKVWGVPCSRIRPEWGAQRIKGLSITGTLLHALKSLLPRKKTLEQKGTETSLIEEFLYPKFGPGHLWETVAAQLVPAGAQIRHEHSVVRLETEGSRIVAVIASTPTGQERIPCDAFLSSMPIQELVRALPEVPAEVQRISDGLIYRDFITVGLLLSRLSIRNQTRIPTVNGIVPDNWIYVQEPDVKLGRIQVFNNWSPYLVQDPETVWIGLEYFCQEGDALWSRSDADFQAFAVQELEKIGVAKACDVLDGTVIRVPKTYPAYFGTYEEFPKVRSYLDGIDNLYCIGRNGQHRYNNQDHSMLSAMEAVECMVQGRPDKSRIWDVNTEESYHEGK